MREKREERERKKGREEETDKYTEKYTDTERQVGSWPMTGATGSRLLLVLCCQHEQLFIVCTWILCMLIGVLWCMVHCALCSVHEAGWFRAARMHILCRAEL